MSQAIEEQYRELLRPVKDPEKSFNINISELLQSYVDSFIQGSVPPNFNSAALLLQGSSSIYGKKVEHLHTLAYRLYQDMNIHNKKDDHTKKNPIKTKEKKIDKENRFNDPFFSTEIKLGKNLSCLKRRVSANVNMKRSKTALLLKPAVLMSHPDEDKGDYFYDIKNEAVGQKGDYALNMCKVTVSGWMVLPVIDAELIPADNAPPDYTDIEIVPNHCYDDNGDCAMQEASPDEGVVMDTPASSQQTSTPDIPSSQQTDEGVGSMTCSPSEPFSQPNSQPLDGTPGSNSNYGSENIPMDGDSENIPMDGVVEGSDEISKSAECSERQALKLRQLENNELVPPPDDNNDDTPKDEEEIVVIKRAIQKKSTVSLPFSLRPGNKNKKRIERISSFCARTYFVVDFGRDKNDISYEVPAMKSCPQFIARMKARREAFHSVVRTKKIDEEAERQDVEVEAISNSSETDKEKLLSSLTGDKDIGIQNESRCVEIEPESQENPIPDIDNPPNAEESILELPPSYTELDIDNCEEMIMAEIKRFSDDIAQHARNSDISKKVQEWEEKLKPFLKELDQRESFDINTYGHRILSSFGSDGDGAKRRKATQTFRNFCKGMEKWEIHRYFMALLPLANIGNVELSTEMRPDGEEDIVFTLLSRQMHHLQLEEFSHNGEGSKE